MFILLLLQIETFRVYSGGGGGQYFRLSQQVRQFLVSCHCTHGSTDGRGIRHKLFVGKKFKSSVSSIETLPLVFSHYIMVYNNNLYIFSNASLETTINTETENF